jgi:hypothetical protein
MKRLTELKYDCLANKSYSFNMFQIGPKPEVQDSTKLKRVMSITANAK